MVTIKKEVAMLDVFLMVTGLKHQPAGKVSEEMVGVCISPVLFDIYSIHLKLKSN